MPHAMGWITDRPDQRDRPYLAALKLGNLPPSVDLRTSCPPVYDQGQLGSCTGQAIAAALEFDQIKQGEPYTPLSRLFIYYCERARENTVNSDAGAMIRDGIWSVAHLGAPPETEWPYDITQFTARPPEQCYTDATAHKALSYMRLGRAITIMKSCLASGYPFVLGISVYQSFESDTVAASGRVPMPGLGEAQLGGHCMLAVGYQDDEQVFIVRNSWSTSWGDAGYCYIPYNYLLSPGLSSDFWTIRTIE